MLELYCESKVTWEAGRPSPSKTAHVFYDLHGTAGYLVCLTLEELARHLKGQAAGHKSQNKDFRVKLVDGIFDDDDKKFVPAGRYLLLANNTTTVVGETSSDHYLLQLQAELMKQESTR